MSAPLPSPLPIKPAPTAREPELVSKWTILNDEWVQATFLLARGKSGLSDRPARSARNGS